MVSSLRKMSVSLSILCKEWRNLLLNSLKQKQLSSLFKFQAIFFAPLYFDLYFVFVAVPSPLIGFGGFFANSLHPPLGVLRPVRSAKERSRVRSPQSAGFIRRTIKERSRWFIRRTIHMEGRRLKEFEIRSASFLSSWVSSGTSRRSLSHVLLTVELK